MSASRRYKIRPYAINTHRATGWQSPELDGRYLPNRYRYSNSDFGRVLGLTSATRQYKVRPCRTKTQESAGFFGWGPGSPGGILLDG